jgi:hypothetical protein
MFWLATERFLPVTLAALVLIAATIFRAGIAQFFIHHGLNMDGLYNAVFGWSAIQTGFVFAVYGFVMSSEGGFIERVRDTTPMNQFLQYTRNATYLGFALTAFSMPLMVSGIKVSREVYGYFAISIWFSLFVWAFLSFARVAFLFGILIRPKTRPLLPG